MPCQPVSENGGSPVLGPVLASVPLCLTGLYGSYQGCHWVLVWISSHISEVLVFAGHPVLPATSHPAHDFAALGDPGDFLVALLSLALYSLVLTHN